MLHVCFRVSVKITQTSLFCFFFFHFSWSILDNLELQPLPAAPLKGMTDFNIITVISQSNRQQAR